jgi:alpha-L-rhamnosidase
MNRKIVSLLILSASIAVLAAAAALAGAYPESASWDASWIWCSGCADSPHNFYMYARRSFELPAAVDSAKVRVTADSRYKLYVNGELVGQGPVKSDRRWLYYDEWDIARFLKPGKNVVAALVHHYGEWTFSYMHGRGGFILEAEIASAGGGRVRVLTDSNWKAIPSEAWWPDIDRMSVQQGFPEIYDSRKEPAGWNEADFDDGAWPVAVELGRPPVDPWPRLIPRTTPDFFEKLVRPVAIVSTGDTVQDEIYEGTDFDLLYPGEKESASYATTNVYSPKIMTATLELSSFAACRVWTGKTALLANYYGETAHMDSVAKPLDLAAGWNPLMVKCVNRSDGSKFIVKLTATEIGGIVFSPYKDPDRQGWAAVGPFRAAGGREAAFKKSFPPQKDPNPESKYKTPDGAELAWKYVGNTDRTLARLGYSLAAMKMLPLEKGRIENAESLIDGSAAPTTVYTGADGAAYVLLDMGREVNGYPRIEIESARGGEIVDVGYTEALEDSNGMAISPLSPAGGHLNASRGGVNYADRYITRPGAQLWETFAKRAFRYMLIVVRDADSPLAIRFAGIRFSTYDVGSRGAFSASDETLNRIWSVGAYTLQMNMDDSFTDCPWRERGEWWGDARVEILVDYYAFGVSALPRRGILQIGESQRDDGLVAGIYPTDWDNRWLPDYALIWVMSAMDYYNYTGDATILPEVLPRIKKLLDGFFLAHENAGHLLQDVPHWVFIDWAPVDKRGTNAALNSFYYKALLDAAALFRAGGDARTADGYEAKAGAVKKSMNDILWDPERGVYADCFTEGARCKTVGQQANSLAVLFDIAPPEKHKSIMLYALDPDKDVVRSGSPYFSYYILSALRHAGMDGEAMAYLMRWKEMLDWGATTYWEVWGTGNSLCHAWSSAPTYDLSRYVLGVYPTAPGYARIGVEPRPGALAYASGVVPTPRGDLPIRWDKDKNGKKFSLSITLPENAPAEIWLPISDIAEPHLFVNGSAALPSGARALGVRGGRIGVEISKPGAWNVTVSD